MFIKTYIEVNQDEQPLTETGLRYYTEMDLNEWHDYDVKVAKEEGFKLGFKQGIDQVIEQSAKKGKVAVMIYLIKEQYNQEALWLYKCTSEQLDEVMTLYISNADYQELMNVKNSHFR
ncbi:MAG: hypothetical protein RR630_05285 [Coprobacillus sp.]